MRAHHFHQTILGLLLLAFWYSSLNLQAGVIYSQVSPAEPVGAFSSVDIPIIGQKVADNFVLLGPGPITIRSVRFIGGYSLRNPPPLTPPLDALPNDGFRIAFLEDVAGSPGAPISGGNFSIGSAFVRTPTGGPLLNGVVTPLEFEVDLGVGIALDPDTEYWISLTNDPGPEHGWAWARANGMSYQLASTFGNIETGPWAIGTSGSMWFELNDANVPEPGTWSLLLLATIAPLVLRNRSRSLSDESVL